jgi:hypothetical protein
MIFKEEQKTQPIERSEVWEAFKRVKVGGKSPGIDGVTIVAVEGNPKKYLTRYGTGLQAEAITPPRSDKPISQKEMEPKVSWVSQQLLTGLLRWSLNRSWRGLQISIFARTR